MMRIMTSNINYYQGEVLLFMSVFMFKVMIAGFSIILISTGYWAPSSLTGQLQQYISWVFWIAELSLLCIVTSWEVWRLRSSDDFLIYQNDGLLYHVAKGDHIQLSYWQCCKLLGESGIWILSGDKVYTFSFPNNQKIKKIVLYVDKARIAELGMSPEQWSYKACQKLLDTWSSEMYEKYLSEHGEKQWHISVTVEQVLNDIACAALKNQFETELAEFKQKAIETEQIPSLSKLGTLQFG